MRKFLLILLCLAASAAVASVHTATTTAASTTTTSHSYLRHLQNEDRQFHLWPSEEIHSTLLKWADQYPQFVRLTTAQEAFGLPRPGNAKDCPFDAGGDGCLNYILTIQDYTVHPEGSDSSNRLPEVLWSGCVHGNERVGPTATMEAVALLLEAATCEAMPNKSHLGKVKPEAWQQELVKAHKCRAALGLSNIERQWLARLLATRRIVVVPTANVLGYFRVVRTEEEIDPNRDFPFDLQDASMCMRTVAGRTLNEVFRGHMFQLSLTFHGGMEVVAYEWGAPTYLHKDSPDDAAQAQISAAYSLYAGGFGRTRPYQYGTMNDLVYYVRGGMEDWAYAGSWDPARVTPCQPTTYGGYPTEKTVYNNSTLRVFNMLVETSDQKIPSQSDLGTTRDILHRDTTGNGHVSRNIRLALLAADLVEPYVSVVGVNDLAISDDVVPIADRSDRSNCRMLKNVMVPRNAKEVTVEWTVGGGMTIDETSLWYGLWQDVDEAAVNCMSQPTNDPSTLLRQAGKQTAVNGTGYFSHSGPHPDSSSSNTGTRPALGPLFRATLDISEFGPRDQLVVVARARLDSSWMQQPRNPGPNVPPQAHVVNARNDPQWRHESAGKTIQGRRDWYTTIPLTLVIGDYSDSVGNQAGKEVGTIELSNRLGDTAGRSGGMDPTRKPTDRPFFSMRRVLGMLFVLAFSAGACIVCVRYRHEARHQRITNELMEEAELEFELGKKGGYSDNVENGDDSLMESDDDEEDDDEPAPALGLGAADGNDGDLELQNFTIT